MALAPGPWTFSVDRLHRLWREGQNTGYFMPEHKFFFRDTDHGISNPEGARMLCLRLRSSVQDPLDHMCRLNASLGRFYICDFSRRYNGKPKPSDDAVSPHDPLQLPDNTTTLMSSTSILILVNSRWWKGLAVSCRSCPLLPWIYWKPCHPAQRLYMTI